MPKISLGNRCIHEFRLLTSDVKKNGAELHLCASFTSNGGEEGIRTLDPHVANVMLYQLSYFPINEKNPLYYTISPMCAQPHFCLLFLVSCRLPTLTHFHRCGLQAVGRCAERDLAGPGAPNEETGDAIVKVVRRNILEGAMPHRIGIAY